MLCYNVVDCGCMRGGAVVVFVVGVAGVAGVVVIACVYM